MKKGEFEKKLKEAGIDYKELKRSFSFSPKKGEPLIGQAISSILKKISSETSELSKIIMPKSIMESHESKMIGSEMKELAYEELKELSLISWHLKKAMLSDEEDKLKAMKKSVAHFEASFNPFKKKLCEEMIKNWKKEHARNNSYIS